MFDETFDSNLLKVEIFENVASLFSKEKMEVYLVGGMVRDFLLKKRSSDFDLALDGDISIINKLFPQDSKIIDKYGCATFFYQGFKFEITCLRKEHYDTYRTPSKIEFVHSLEIDSLRRDFTINALYMDKEEHIYDFHNGIPDLNNRLIRIVGDVSRYNEDPLRILRAIRMATNLDFRINKDDYRYIKDNFYLLNGIAPSLIIDEIKKFSSTKYLFDDFEMDLILYKNNHKIRKHKILKFSNDCKEIIKLYDEGYYLFLIDENIYLELKKILLSRIVKINDYNDYLQSYSKDVIMVLDQKYQDLINKEYSNKELKKVLRERDDGKS